ncbi:MAG: hypothetical protein R3E08_01855 [Thiotrichaceae bacterium]
MRATWLLQLAKQKNWAMYLDNYTPQQDKVLQCNQLTAYNTTGEETDR